MGRTGPAAGFFSLRAFIRKFRIGPPHFHSTASAARRMDRRACRPGTRLSTLCDAGAFLLKHFATVTQSAVLGYSV